MSVRAEQLQRAAWTKASAPKTIGICGIALGILTLSLALPPFGVRTVPTPVAVGILGAAAGIWAVSRREARIGWIAVVLSLVGVAGALLAMRATSSNLEGVFVWSALIAATLRYATPLTFAAIGGMFSERSGVVNIGLEGMMLMGAFFGVLGADKLGSWEAGLVIAMIAGGGLALVHAFFAIQLRADQIVGGTAINFLALGITGYLYIDLYKEQGTPTDLAGIPDVNFSWLSHIPPHGLGHFLDDAFGGLNLMVWLSF